MKTILVIPDDKLSQIVAIIRDGIIINDERDSNLIFIKEETKEYLRRWCNDCERYLNE